MIRITKSALALAVSIAGAAPVLADSGHGHAKHPHAMMGERAMNTPKHDMHGMMGHMMRMHGHMHPGRMMGAGHGMGNAMMDRDLMHMMMGGALMGDLSPDQVPSSMLARLAEFDADKNGSLSLAEFEALHAAMIREHMVDRFQHLDADGDGKVTEAEMTAPGLRMQMRHQMSGWTEIMREHMPSDD